MGTWSRWGEVTHCCSDFGTKRSVLALLYFFESGFFE